MNLRALGTWVVVLGCALSTFSEPLRLIERQIDIPERGSVTGYLLSLGTNHFSFFPPALWRTSHRPGAGSVVIMSSNGTTSISIDFLSVKPDEEMPKPLSLIKQRFADGAVGKAFDCHTGLGRAIAYDIQRKPANDLRLTSRVIYVFTPAAAVEFTLTGPTPTFSEHTTAFAGLVSSFRVPGR
jgi:hypothetical protein